MSFMTITKGESEFYMRRRIYADWLNETESESDQFVAQNSHYQLQPELADRFDQRKTGFIHSCYRVAKQGKEDTIYYIYGERDEYMFKILLNIEAGKQNVFHFENEGKKSVPARTFYRYAEEIEDIIISLPKHRLAFTTGLCRTCFKKG